MELYIRKIFPHDLTHEVSFTQDIHWRFFNGQYSMSFYKSSGSSTVYTVTANDATDLRFGGDFKSMLPVTLAVGDLLRIEKLDANQYVMTVITPTSSVYIGYNLQFGSRQRHLLISNGVTTYKR